MHLLQLADFVGPLAVLPLEAVLLLRLHGAARHRAQQLIALALELLCGAAGARRASGATAAAPPCSRSQHFARAG
jgi:hypothetical protein